MLLLLVVVVLVLMEREGGRRSLAVVVVVVVLHGHGGRCGLTRGRWGGRRRERWLGRKRRRGRRGGLPIVTQVLVLLAEAVQLDLQLLDAAPLRFQKFLLALNDVVEFEKVLHGPIRALWAALARPLISIHASRV